MTPVLAPHLRLDLAPHLRSTLYISTSHTDAEAADGPRSTEIGAKSKSGDFHTDAATALDRAAAEGTTAITWNGEAAKIAVGAFDEIETTSAVRKERKPDRLPRSPSGKRQTRDVPLHFRIARYEHQIAFDAAAKLGLSMSEFCRQACALLGSVVIGGPVGWEAELIDRRNADEVIGAAESELQESPNGSVNNRMDTVA